MKPMPIHLIFILVATLVLSPVILATSGKADSMHGDLSKIDPISVGCLACHDGSNEAAGQHVMFCLLDTLGKGCGGHIVSASYVELASRNKNLYPVSNLPPQLVLHEGKITCVTCHGDEPHTGTSLVIENRHSSLCRICHMNY
jgi:hypothetical protein